MSKNKKVASIEFGVHINTDSETMTVGAVRYEIAALLENIASQLLSGSSGGILRDHEAKRVGTWALKYEVANGK